MTIGWFIFDFNHIPQNKPLVHIIAAFIIRQTDPVTPLFTIIYIVQYLHWQWVFGDKNEIKQQMLGTWYVASIHLKVHHVALYACINHVTLKD